MKRIITLSCVLLLICSCSNSTKTTVDLTVGNIGDTVSIIDESVGNENWYIVTDTVCYNDTIVNQLVQLTCEKYDSLKKTIHRGENCRANNAAALAIAKQSGDKERIAYLNNQNDEAEKNAAKASIELIEHLQVCDACKKLNNQQCIVLIMPTIESISAPRLRYSQQLDDQRWKWKADNIRKRDEHKCRVCGKSNRQLDVHHIRYVEGRQAWDYDESDLVTLCHECHEKVHEHQEFIDSLHGGSLFYDTGFKGVGIVERFYDNGIWFHICWTEAETYEGVNHGRLYVEAETSFVNMRKPTEDEIIEFWGDIDKYCSDWMIIHYVNRYYDLIPQNHSLLKRIDQIKKSGEFYNDGSPDHQALAIKYFENYVVENGYLKKETDIIYRDILFNPFYLRYNISILYKFQNDQGQWEEKEISGIVCFDIENDGSYSIRLNGNKKG